jgi:hypothetical protein
MLIYLQKVISWKNLKEKFFVFVGVLKVNDENSRIRNRIRIHLSEAWIPYQNVHNTVRCVSLGEKPYKCRHCDTGFAQRTSLNVHMASHHKGVAPVSSPLKAGLEKNPFFF